VKLHSALLAAEQEYQAVVRDKPSRFGKYATLCSIYSAVKPALARQGLRLQETLEDGKLTVAVCNADGHSVSSSTTIGELADFASPGKGLTPSQAHGSAITYGRRYLTLVLLGICPSDDDDGESATRKPKGLNAGEIHWVCKKVGIEDTKILSAFLKKSGYTSWASYDKDKSTLANDYLRAQGRETIDDIPY